MNRCGLYWRQMNETIKNYVRADDLDRLLEKVEQLGEIMMPREIMPDVGFVAKI